MSVRRGDPLQIAADDWNSVLAMLAAWRSGADFSLAGVPNRRELPGNLLIVKNATGADRARFALVGLGDPVYDYSDNPAEFLNQAAFEAEEPNTGDHECAYAILQEPIAAGRFGVAMICGQSRALINVRNASHQEARFKDASYELETVERGGTARVLWKESGTGTGKFCQILFPFFGGAGLATRVQGLLVGAMATGDATHTMDNIEGLNGPPPSAPLTFNNLHGWGSDDNSVVKAEWNGEDEDWDAYQVDCPS